MMCQSKENGGKRCDHGLNGTRAVKQLIQVGLDKNSKEADILWKAEYAEAKSLETNATADPAEVKEFISEQRYKVNGSPTISDHDKKIIITNLEKAKKESPTRRALRAWRNIMKRVWNKQVITAAALIGAVSLTAACTPNDKPADITPGNSQPGIEQPATASPTTDQVPTDIEAVPGLKPLNESGFTLTQDVYSNVTGNYRKWSVNADSPMRDLFSNENIVLIDFDENKRPLAQEAWQDALDFITKETVDSTLAGEFAYSDWTSSKGTEQRDVYVKELSEKWFSSETSLRTIEDSLIEVEKTKHIFPGYLDTMSDLGDYSYKDGYPRILQLDVMPVQVSTPATSITNSNVVRFWVDITSTRKSVINGKTQYVTAPMRLELGLTDIDKDPVESKWKITEYQVISLGDPIYFE